MRPSARPFLMAAYVATAVALSFPPFDQAPEVAAQGRAAAPPQAAAADVRMRTVYSAAGMKTDTVTYIKGPRERFEFQDMVLLKQHDQRRTIQISKAANTYFVVPDGQAATPALPGASQPPQPQPAQPQGVVMVATTITDTGERKTVFGREARRVKTAIDKQPMQGACDTSKQRIETDGWYIDLPAGITQPSAGEQGPPSVGCADQIQATTNGNAAALGFPISYTTTVTGNDAMPVVATMEIVELELTTLDPALFEIPAGLNAAPDMRALSRALSEANETKLAAAQAAAPPAPAPKAPGAVRIGVPELTNKTSQTVDTRALRQRLIGDLTDAGFEAVPMAAAPSDELRKRAVEHGFDYVLFAEVAELKVNKPGGFGGLMKAAGGIAGAAGGVAGGAAGAAAGAAAPKENTESSVAVRLVQPDGRQRLSTTTTGKDGSGFSLKTGLAIAKFAGGMYLNMMAAPLMLARLNSMGAGNMGGMGMLGNPMLYRMQGAGFGGPVRGMGIDVTAGAGAYLLQTAMSMNDLGGYVGVPGQGPSYDESIGEALQNAVKAVQKSLERK